MNISFRDEEGLWSTILWSTFYGAQCGIRLMSCLANQVIMASILKHPLRLSINNHNPSIRISRFPNGSARAVHKQYYSYVNHYLWKLWSATAKVHFYYRKVNLLKLLIWFIMWKVNLLKLLIWFIMIYTISNYNCILKLLLTLNFE